MAAEITDVIDVHEIWSETELAVLLILASSKQNKPFVIWAERSSDKTTFISRKYFNEEAEALKAFKLLSEVLVEINDPAIAFLKNISTTDPQ
jgi:hypothetical protein